MQQRMYYRPAASALVHKRGLETQMGLIDQALNVVLVLVVWAALSVATAFMWTLVMRRID